MLNFPHHAMLECRGTVTRAIIHLEKIVGQKNGALCGLPYQKGAASVSCDVLNRAIHAVGTQLIIGPV
jgi:hypothetical protein